MPQTAEEIAEELIKQYAHASSHQRHTIRTGRNRASLIQKGRNLPMKSNGITVNIAGFYYE